MEEREEVWKMMNDETAEGSDEYYEFLLKSGHFDEWEL